MLLKMVDGGIINIESEEWFSSGCETCDHGSNYTNDVTFVMANGRIKIEISQMYKYALSQGYMMTLILPNVGAIEKMTERAFAEWLNGNLSKKFSKSLKVCSYGKN